METLSELCMSTIAEWSLEPPDSEMANMSVYEKTLYIYHELPITLKTNFITNIWERIKINPRIYYTWTDDLAWEDDLVKILIYFISVTGKLF